jgi:chlorite dismutase
MDLKNSQRDVTEQSGLRLVTESADSNTIHAVEKQFVNYMFFRVNPEWRQLDKEKKSADKEEFERTCREFYEDFLLFSYSLVGFDSKADLMLWRIGMSLDRVQEMTARLFHTGLGSYLETADNYLSVTKKMMFVNGGTEDRLHVRPGANKYLFVYPCGKHIDWYQKSAEERDALIEENYMVGRKFSNIKIHMTYAFGFSEQEYLFSFETDEPRDFLVLAEELRETPASRFILRGRPVYTCRQRPLMECLDALG